MNPLLALRSPEHSLLCSPIGLHLIDSYTNAAPSGPVGARVDICVGAEWIETLLRPTRTSSGVLTLPGLGRRADPLANNTPARYRLRLEVPQYIPEYRRMSDGFEFLAPAWNDANPPVIPNANVRAIALHPAPDYLYDGCIRVIHGRVRDAAGPLRDAVVEFQGLDRAMTDERGEFSFGLRRAPVSGPVVIDVHHDRTARSQSFTLQLPAALRANQVLTLV